MQQIVKRYRYLSFLTIAGVAGMVFMTWALYAFEEWLGDHGYEISPEVFLIAFFVLVGGTFSLAARAALREVDRLKKG